MSSMPVTVSEKDVKRFEKLKLLSHITPLKEKIRFLRKNMIQRSTFSRIQ